jgi:hypothetical protein
MKLTKSKLKQIIKEELTQILSENDDSAHFEVFWEEKGKDLEAAFVKTLGDSQSMLHHPDDIEDIFSSWFIPPHRKDSEHYLKAKDSFQFMAKEIEAQSAKKIEELWRHGRWHRGATGAAEAFKNGMEELYLALAKVHDDLPTLNRI